MSRRAESDVLRLYLVAYDVAAPKRWRKLYKLVRASGARLQYSLFACRLTAAQARLLGEAMTRCLDASCDRLAIVDLGPAADGERRLQLHGPQALPAAPELTFL